MKVKLKDLLLFAEKIIKHLEKEGVKEIELEKDFYWDIPYPQIYDMNSDPSELLVGQLYDDLEFLKKMLEDDGEPIGHALVWLSSILRYAGETNVA